MSDGVASDVAVTQGSVGVQLVAGSAFSEQMGASTSLVNLTYGFDGDDTIYGGGQGDYLFGGSGDDTIRGRGGDDQVTGGAGADIFEFESASNGLDTVKDFSGTQDILDFDAILSGGIYNSGTSVNEAANSEISLASVNDKFVYFQVTDISSVTINEANLFGSSLDFAAEGTNDIEFVLAVGESSGSDGVKVYQVTDSTGSNDMSITQIALIEGTALDDILTSSIDAL